MKGGVFLDHCLKEDSAQWSELAHGYLVLWGGALVLQATEPRFAAGQDHEHRGDSSDPRHKDNTTPKKATVPQRSHNANTSQDKWLGHTKWKTLL
jgi:hypothetical protein